MKNSPEGNSEQIATDQTRAWVAEVVAAAQGVDVSLRNAMAELQKFQKYTDEVYAPVLSSYIRAIHDSTGDPNAFVRSIVGLAGTMFVAGYIEGTQRQLEIDRLNRLFDNDISK